MKVGRPYKIVAGVVVAGSVCLLLYLYFQSPPKIAELRRCKPGEGMNDAHVYGETFSVKNLSSKELSLVILQVEIKDNNKWTPFRQFVLVPMHGSTEFLPGQTEFFAVHPFPDTPWWGSPWKMHVRVFSRATGIAALPSWIRMCCNPALRRMYPSVWKVPPFGNSVKSWGNPRADLISEEIR